MSTVGFPNTQVLQLPNMEPMTCRSECRSNVACSAAHGNMHKEVVTHICLEHPCRRSIRHTFSVTQDVVKDNLLCSRYAATCLHRLYAWQPPVQCIHTCAKQKLDQALTIDISVAFPKHANDV